MADPNDDDWGVLMLFLAVLAAPGIILAILAGCETGTR